MTLMLGAVIALLSVSPARGAAQVDYTALWEEAAPFHTFLEGVKARRDQWHSRFANAAVEPGALTEARALPGRRRILAIAEDRCSDSAWAIPYIAKLAAAVPEKLELRVLPPADGHRVQAAHLTPDNRMATPTVVVLDEQNRYIGGWVERPAELQKWYLENRDSTETDDRYAHVHKWYTEDAGRSTIRELLAIAAREPKEEK